MTEQTKIIVADVGEIEALRAEVRALRLMLEGATVTPAPDWVSIGDAAKHYDVDVSTVHRWIGNGRIEAKGAGKMRRVKIR